MKHNITLGILGGGQLGRMSAMAAARLGISVIIFCPEENSPASHVSKETIIAPYDDKNALKMFSDLCDVITYEFENIPVETIDYLVSLKENSVLPEKVLLNVSQDRVKEKQFVNDCGIETARWAAVTNISDIQETAEDWGAKSFVIKTTRFGYDGKGQIKATKEDFSAQSELLNFLEKTKDQDLIMEDMIDFDCEVSMIVARDIYGKTECYGPMLNNHKNHILHTTTVPSGLTDDIAHATRDASKVIADKVNLTGVLTVEFFICKDGSVLVNEIAPRTHNSGHWSIDACAVSQFENHVRTVCGLPAGSTARHNDAVMLNLIGNDIDIIDAHLSEKDANVHLYGKEEAREGRKMGHITFLKPLTQSK
jgi:5-(carboxyamino)imidazole ribonucleotide synthase